MVTVDDILAKYKKHPFSKGLLPFGPTLKTVETPFAKIVAKQEGRQRWVICDKETGTPALFSHAAIFAESDDPETGNYVPAKEEVPPGIDVKVVQRRANTRCFYTYVLDTFVDKSLYEGQWALDDYMAQVEGFNPRTLPRRPYLSGLDERYRSRFWMQTPMFLRSEGQQIVSEGIAHLHKWVVDADRQSKVFRANPDRPRIWVKDGDATVPIGDREPGGLQRGDAVALSFTVTYHVTTTNWFPQFHPADLVVVKPGAGDVTDYSAPAIDLASRPVPSFGAVELDDSDGEELEAGVGGRVDTKVPDGPSEVEYNQPGSPSGTRGVEEALVVVVPSNDSGESSLRRKRSSETLDSADENDEDAVTGGIGLKKTSDGALGDIEPGEGARAIRGGSSKRSVRRRL